MFMIAPLGDVGRDPVGPAERHAVFPKAVPQIALRLQCNYPDDAKT
jgi:hypothetical protein